ncbi:unnamed protein product [Pleuronectes platessa]|uniref:Uncharacterized protein n=1 Tax=Pleuronectes platessa TaxID=8262 RepID=A0A9N7UR17_PLEPL|nr:unnamed protein product [Pleuronectes platessa]
MRARDGDRLDVRKPVRSVGQSQADELWMKLLSSGLIQAVHDGSRSRRPWFRFVIHKDGTETRVPAQPHTLPQQEVAQINFPSVPETQQHEASAASSFLQPDSTEPAAPEHSPRRIRNDQVAGILTTR